MSPAPMGGSPESAGIASHLRSTVVHPRDHGPPCNQHHSTRGVAGGKGARLVGSKRRSSNNAIDRG